MKNIKAAKVDQRTVLPNKFKLVRAIPEKASLRNQKYGSPRANLKSKHQMNL